MKKAFKFLYISFLLSLLPQLTLANDFAVLFGTSQPILFRGYNVEINYLTDNWVFEYSHGWELKLHEFKEAMTDEEQEQDLKIRLPYTTGGGVGYRLTKNFHMALEYKVHQFEVTHSVEGVFKYTTQTLGVGMYYTWHPFGEKGGLTIVPTLRYWPTIGTSLDEDKKVFSNGDTHEAHKFDITPNVKIGYTF